jgi:hypothetical protein
VSTNEQRPTEIIDVDLNTPCHLFQQLMSRKPAKLSTKAIPEHAITAPNVEFVLRCGSGARV